jgi:hypothetical protein
VPQLKDPVKLTLTGPYEGQGKGKLPKVDWDIAVNAAGQSFSAGFISTGDNAFVNVQGTDYEVGAQAVTQINAQLAAAQKQSGNKGLSQFGVNAKNWLKDAKEEGDEDVAGVKTTHVSAAFDVSRFLDDVNKLVSQAGTLPGGPQARQLTEAEKKQVRDIVKNPRFDLYVGKDDNIIRRLSADMTFDVPESRRQQVNGLSGGSIRFSVEFRDVGKPQTIQAPTGAKPLAELTSRLGGLGALGGAGGGSGSSGSGSGASGASGAAGANFQAYSDCLQKADPNDAAALDKCSELLK